MLGVGVTATFGQMCLTRAFTAGDPAKVSVICLTQVVFAFALHLPDLAEEAGGETFAPRATAKHHDVAAQERRTRRKFHDRFAP